MENQKKVKKALFLSEAKTKKNLRKILEKGIDSKFILFTYVLILFSIIYKRFDQA